MDASLPPDLIHRALDYIADGQSVRAAARKIGVPRIRLRWELSRPEWAPALARARSVQADSIVDSSQVVVDRTLQGTLEPNAARVVLEWQRWYAGRLKPAVYGDRIEAHLTASQSFVDALQALSRVVHERRQIEQAEEPIDVTPDQQPNGE